MISVKRHILKTISYRLLGTLSTIIIACSFGVNLELASILGFGELCVKPLLYFVHERIWYKYIKFGVKQ